jgi:hypothetical protein
MMQSVQVIIERLKSHPEEFFGGYEDRGLGTLRPKFYDITDKIDNLLTDPQTGHIHRLWYLEPEEKEALLAAYKEARRARFEAKTFHTLLTVQEPEEHSTVTYRAINRYDPHTGKALMQGGAVGSSIIAPHSMVNQAKQLLDQEFQKQYAKSNHTRP